MSSIKSTEIEGDVNVGRNVAIGGDTTVQGQAHVKRDLTVEGWLRAANMLIGNKGSFSDVVKFLKGVEFGNYIEDLTGGKIDENGAAELDSLKLRKFLEVPELRYNRIDIQIGNKWNAPGGGIIEKCVPDLDENGNRLMTGTIYLHLEEGEIGTIEEDDICQGIYHAGMETGMNSEDDQDDSIGNFRFTGFYTCYFRVTKIQDRLRKSRFRYALRGLSDNWNLAYHPCEGMHFVGYGNFTIPERQTSRYSTRTYERFLQHVDDWEFRPENVAAQFGDLSNLNVFGLEMDGYSAYLNNIYMSGVIKQFELIPLRMEIDTQGDTFLAYGEHLHVTCRIFKGWDDITEQVTRWEVIRDSGDYADDAAWGLRPKVRNFSGEIDIHLDKDNSIDDLGNSDTSCLFTFKAFISGDITPATMQLTI